MKQRTGGISPGWWTLAMLVAIVAFVLTCSAMFAGTFRSYVPVIVTADRAGLVLETGAKVRMRGVVVGRVGSIEEDNGAVHLNLEMFPDELQAIPADLEAEIKATTVFGAKYVELIPSPDASGQRLTHGAVLQSRNVSTEVNTVFENLVGVLDQIDVAKLNSTLAALADGVRGKGERIGRSIVDADEVLLAVNPRMETFAQDWRSLEGFSDAYSAAAQDILAALEAATTTADTVVTHANDLDALLLSAIGLSEAGINLMVPTKDNFIRSINTAKPTVDLLMKYNPVYTCLLIGAQSFLDNGGLETLGGDGRTAVVDATVLFGDDPYRYPEHLPIIGARGGPGGKPSCGSLPDATKNFPVRQLVTNTGFGTGDEYRTNPGIGHPWYVNFFPQTRAVPEPPSVRGEGPPAPGPVPHQNAPHPIPAQSEFSGDPTPPAP